MSPDQNNPAPDWLKTFPELAAITEPAWRSALRMTQIVKFPPHTSLYKDGEACQHLILIISGNVKVEKISETGQEITLYHLRPGQICELTTSCLMSGKCYHADAITETPVSAALIPKVAFQQALAESPEFQRYIYAAVEKGMADLVSLLESSITEPMGMRLAHYLVEQAELENPVSTTHYEIATELGTAREVISRLLKEFENRDCIRRQRGKIEIIDLEQLRLIAKQVSHQPPS